MNNNVQIIKERLFNGIIKENPTFVMVLGMCPTLAVTTSCINGIGMGLTTTVVLTLSNMLISLMRNIIPEKVRVPSFIVVVASFVTLVQFMLEAYLPSLNDALGIYIPLIVVNCIILGRAESYASKNPVIPSIFDGVGMGLGFTVGLGALGAFREILGAGSIFGIYIFPESLEPIRLIGLAPGAFFVLAFLVAAQNKIKASRKEKGEVVVEACTSDCGSCKTCIDRVKSVIASDKEEFAKVASKEAEKKEEN